MSKSTYFKNVETLEELRRQYKTLLEQYHRITPVAVQRPHRRLIQRMTSYFKRLKDRHESKATYNKEDRQKASYDDLKYSFAEDEKLRAVLQSIIMFAGINIEIIGCWIWVDGDTYPCKNDLYALGFKWAREKKKWYFHTEAFRKKSKKKLSIDDIRDYYGSTEFKPEERKQIRQA